MDDDDPLGTWGLRPVQFSDRDVMAPYFACLSEPLSDYTFSQVFTWRNSLRILWRVLDGHLCVFANGSGDLTLLMPPIGEGASSRALAGAFDLMDQYNAAKGVLERSRVEYVSQELLDRCGRDGMTVQPMGADYVYDVNRMIDLAGGDLASKRQAKNRFLRNYEHRVEVYDPSLHLESCSRLLQSWKQRQDAGHWDEIESSALKRRKETVATELTLLCARELSLEGLVVHVNSPQGWQLGGFTFGERLGPDQSSIIIEKTDLEVKGLAQFIFSEFCRRYWSDRPLVNVGDDWGMETLAWTKMSYRPVKMLQKYVLRKAAVAKIAVPAQDAASSVIRVAAKDDLAAAVEMELGCFSSQSIKKRQLQYLQQRKSAIFLVAEEAGQIVGEGIALVRQHRRGCSGRIYSLAVRPDRRRRQLGRRILQAMISQLSARGVRRVFLTVEEQNIAAIRLYERCGFEHIGILPDYFGPGQPALHMVCQAPRPPGLFDAPNLDYNPKSCATASSKSRLVEACSS